MRLQSARDLKQELLSSVVLPYVQSVARASISPAMLADVPAAVRALVAAARPFAVGARALADVPLVQRSLALGVAEKGRQYRLAVRVQRQALMGSRLLEHIVKEARNEVDVRLIGKVDKREAARRRAAGAKKKAAGPARAAAMVISPLAAPWYRGDVRPLLIGASVAHVDVTAGTLGCFVTRDGQTFILSNNHVLANENQASNGDVVLQRAPYDGGRNPANRVATLRHSIALMTNGPNLIDAALARVDDKIELTPGLLRGLVGGHDRQLAGLGPDELDEGDAVHKVGRTTGPTEGRITAFDMDNVVVSYDIGNCRFDNQIEIEGTGNLPFSDGGDSGSLIVNASMQAVGLLFAGSDVGGTNGLGLMYASPIREVLSQLKATIIST